MKVITVNTNPLSYSCKVYLLLGTWNTLDDVNTVIDTGADGYIIDQIKKINTGVGKKPVNNVIITHDHFDHTGGIRQLKEEFGVTVYAKTRFNPLVDKVLEDNQQIRIADRYFTVLHTPGHSSDSISLYCDAERMLFSGDTNLLVRDSTGTFTPEYAETLKRLAKLKLDIIYPGHGEPMKENPGGILHYSLNNVLKSKIV